MTVMPHDRGSALDERTVREQLNRIQSSEPFHKSQRRQRFLEYIVEETLAGRGDRLKAYTIAVEVFERPETFDPLVDPVVRIEAGRLRDKLREYYQTAGSCDPICIELPKGGYAPVIARRTPAPTAPPVDQDPGAAHRLIAASDQPSEVFAGSRSTTTPESAPAASPPSQVSGVGPKQWAMLGAALALIIAASLWLVAGRNAGDTLTGMPSIAVLPFDNIGHDARWDRFADGITEDIITDLSRFRNLAVIARNSTAQYKNKPTDVRGVGRDLNVRYVLEGSIQPIGERIRVTAQLIDAAAGSHVWSQRYDRPANDLFKVQDDVAQQIAATLGVYQGAVAEAERSVIRRKAPASLTAYETYLLGVEAKHQVTRDSLIKAEALLQKAVELDPQLARAYVAMVDVQCYMIDLGLAPSMNEALAKMMDAGEKAVVLDPNDGKAHMALAFAHLYHRKPQQAAAELDRAEALAPSDADVLVLIAWSLPGLGQSQRALALAERALALNPHYPDWYNQGLGVTFFFGGQYERSIRYRLLVKEPFALDYAFLAIAHGYLGRMDEAKAAAARVASLDPAWNAERYLSEGGGYADREAETFVDGARKVGLPDCVPADKLKDWPDLIHIQSCDALRALAP